MMSLPSATAETLCALFRNVNMASFELNAVENCIPDSLELFIEAVTSITTDQGFKLPSEKA